MNVPICGGCRSDLTHHSTTSTFTGSVAFPSDVLMLWVCTNPHCPMCGRVISFDGMEPKHIGAAKPA